MKKHSTICRILRAAACTLLTLAIPAAFFALRAADKTAAAVSSQLAKDMIGSWVLGRQARQRARGSRVRGAPQVSHRASLDHTQANPDTGLLIMHDGSTYTLDGDKYVESIEYANQSTANDIGKSFMFTVKVEGDTMTQIGVGNPYSEVWKRLK